MAVLPLSLSTFADRELAGPVCFVFVFLLQLKGKKTPSFHPAGFSAVGPMHPLDESLVKRNGLAQHSAKVKKKRKKKEEGAP